MNRGLTLIEVVLATVLLTLIVSVSLPIVGAARRDRKASQSLVLAGDFRQDLFERAVDDLLGTHPGLAAELLNVPSSGRELHWSSRDQPYTANAMIVMHAQVRNEEHRSHHCWVSFTSGSNRAIRWLPLPHSTQESDS